MMIEELKNEASRGNVDAQFQLANYYYNGNNVKKDIDEAIYWYMEASENNHSKASEILGEIYTKGLNDEIDNEIANIFFEKSNLSKESIILRQDKTLLEIEEKKIELQLKDLGAYAGELPKAETLSIEEEIQLFRSFNAGNNEVKEKLVISNLRLVYFILLKYSSQSDSMFWDYFQAGVMGLIVAIERFEVEKGYKFSTYAYQWIRQHINRSIKNDSRIVRIPVYIWETKSKINNLTSKLKHLSGEELVDKICIELEISKDRYFEIIEIFERKYIHDVWTGDDGSNFDFLKSKANPEADLFQKVRTEGLDRALSKLSDREEKVLRFRYGLDNGDPRTLEEIGVIFKVTRERIRQIEKKAFMKIKKIIKKENDLYSLLFKEKKRKTGVNDQKILIDKDLLKIENKGESFKMGEKQILTVKDIYLEISEMEDTCEKNQKILNFLEKYSEDIETEKYRYELYQDLILSYLESGEVSKVRKYSEEAMEIFNEKDNSVFEEIFNDSLDEEYFKVLNKRAEEFADNEKPKMALNIYKQMIEKFEFFEYSNRFGVYRDMGDIYSEIDPEMAISYYKKAIELDKSKTIVLSTAINVIIEEITNNSYEQAMTSMIKKDYITAKPHLEDILNRLNDLGSYNREFFGENKLIYTDALLDLKDIAVNTKDQESYLNYYKKAVDLFGVVEEIEEINQEFNTEIRIEMVKSEPSKVSEDISEENIEIPEDKKIIKQETTEKIQEKKLLKKEEIKGEDVKELVLEILENIRKEDIDLFNSMKEAQGNEREVKGFIRGIEAMLEMKFGMVGLDMVPEVSKIKDLNELDQIKEKIMATKSPQDVEELINSFK